MKTKKSLETCARRTLGDGPLQFAPFENQVFERDILEIFGAADRHHTESTVSTKRFRAVQRTIGHLQYRLVVHYFRTIFEPRERRPTDGTAAEHRRSNPR